MGDDVKHKDKMNQMIIENADFVKKMSAMKCFPIP
jgi:hypothetical protein